MDTTVTEAHNYLTQNYTLQHVSEIWSRPHNVTRKIQLKYKRSTYTGHSEADDTVFLH